MDLDFELTGWREMRRGSLYGFAEVTFAETLVICDVAIRDGKSGPWAGLPSRSYVDRDGAKQYQPIVKFATREDGSRFSDDLIDAIRSNHPEALPPDSRNGRRAPRVPQAEASEKFLDDEIPF